jgi:hypothetical protein
MIYVEVQHGVELLAKKVKQLELHSRLVVKMDARKELCPSFPDQHMQRIKCFLGFWRQLLQRASSTSEASLVLSTCVRSLHWACVLVTWCVSTSQPASA